MKNTYIGALALAGVLSAGPARAVTTQQADEAFQAFNKVYWNASGKYFYKRDGTTNRGTLDFWLSAHAWETVMDAYVRTGKAEYKQQIKDVYDGFIKQHGTDWTQNDFNDDIAWWVIASARAYEITGETRYLTQAKSQFDWVYRTQRDTVLGGIWWKNNTHAEKNSCVVQPMIISAAFLAKGLKDDSYRVKAESLYAWQRRTLVDANTGKVYDNIKTNGSRSSYSSTYNQGTWIGSAVLLGHLADAKKAADWTKANMCNSSGIFTESGQGDVGGFKLIGARYIMLLSKQPGAESYAQWMEANAARVWSNRRSDGIMGYNWNSPAPSSGIEAQCAAGGVSLMNLLVPSIVAIRLPDSRSKVRAGVAMMLNGPGNGSEVIWLFRKDDAHGLPSALRRLDGRIHR
jgi:predicted alpha-1,6-mannanase (GH76 family)